MDYRNQVLNTLGENCSWAAQKLRKDWVEMLKEYISSHVFV